VATLRRALAGAWGVFGVQNAKWRGCPTRRAPDDFDLQDAAAAYNHRHSSALPVRAVASVSISEEPTLRMPPLSAITRGEVGFSTGLVFHDPHDNT
jgi:hypothetical protein